MKTKVKGILTFALVLSIVIALLPVQNVVAKGAKLNRTSLTITKGKSYTLKVRNNGKAKINWKTSNSAVATVSNSGLVKAVNKGTAVITATVSKKSFNCKVTVEEPYLSAESLKLRVGDTDTLLLNGTVRSVRWQSSDATVVTVWEGRIAAKKRGTAKVTASIGKEKYTCKIEVTRPTIKHIDTYVYDDDGLAYEEHGDYDRNEFRTCYKNIRDDHSYTNNITRYPDGKIKSIEGRDFDSDGTSSNYYYSFINNDKNELVERRYYDNDYNLGSIQYFKRNGKGQCIQIDATNYTTEGEKSYTVAKLLYDSHGYLTKLTLYGNFSYEYDDPETYKFSYSDGKLISQRVTNGSYVNGKQTYQYNNGVLSSVNGDPIQYEYDQYGEIVRVELALSTFYPFVLDYLPEIKGFSEVYGVVHDCYSGCYIERTIEYYND